MDKTDLTKLYKSYYTARTSPELIELGPVRYISILGEGDPSGEDFAHSIETLYSVAYTIKFAYKPKQQDFVVAKLEGLWWYDEQKFPGRTISTASAEVPRSAWQYRLLIRMPDFVSSKSIVDARDQVVSRKGLERARQVEPFELHEGKTVQMMHVGPFNEEAKTLQAIVEYMEGHQLKRNGLHHEIYLSDFRKTPPEKLKTILREPAK